LPDTAKYQILRISIILISIFSVFGPAVSAQSEYNETISILQSLHQDEIQAMNNYQAYAKKAVSQKYPNIGKLFMTLAASESVHARNFSGCLAKLGVAAEQIPPQPIKVHSTRKNLKFAIAVELEEIDRKYPQVLEQIKPENHAAAIQYITYAWESEKQHRELLKRIQSGTGMFFGLLTKRIEGNPYQYFVCHNCGSTLSEIPATACPVCAGPAAKYEEITLGFYDDVVDGKNPDGAFEIENARNEMLGADGFLEILKNLDSPMVQLSKDVLEKELLKFSNDIRLQDDITIIEVRFAGQNTSG
jgi:rubrerythrin